MSDATMPQHAYSVLLDTGPLFPEQPEQRTHLSLRVQAFDQIQALLSASADLGAFFGLGRAIDPTLMEVRITHTPDCWTCVARAEETVALGAIHAAVRQGQRGPAGVDLRAQDAPPEAMTEAERDAAAFRSLPLDVRPASSRTGSPRRRAFAPLASVPASSHVVPQPHADAGGWFASCACGWWHRATTQEAADAAIRGHVQAPEAEVVTE